MVRRGSLSGPGAGGSGRAGPGLGGTRPVPAGQPDRAAPNTKLGSVQDSAAPAPYPWPPQSATGVGSMPGTDPLEAMRLILDELPDLPHLVELPDRGVGADMIGRTAGLLIDLPVDTTTRGWRLADRPGRDMRRAQSLLARDLDALEEAADGYQGTLKLQVCGPWTMAASLELARSQEPVLADPGAVRDLITSLAEGVAAHVAGVAARVPGARLLLQVDEPSLPAVLAGEVPSASGFNRVRAVEEADAVSGLRAVLSATAAPTLVHCCGMSAPGWHHQGSGRGRGGDRPWRAAPRGGRGAGGGGRGGPRDLRGRGACHAGDGRPAAAPAGQPRAGGPAADATSPQRNRSGTLPDAKATADRVVELWRRMGWPAARHARRGRCRGPGGDHPGLRSGRCPAGVRPGRAGRLP